MIRVNLRTCKAFSQLLKKAITELVDWQHEISQVKECGWVIPLPANTPRFITPVHQHPGQDTSHRFKQQSSSPPLIL